MNKFLFLILLLMTPFLNAQDSRLKIEKYNGFSKTPFISSVEMSDAGFRRIKKMEKEKKMFDIFHNVVMCFLIILTGIIWIVFIQMLSADKAKH